MEDTTDNGPCGFETQMRQRGFDIVEEGDVKMKQGGEDTKELFELNDENPIGVDFSNAQQYTLPPDPKPLREWYPDDNRYSDSQENYPARLTFKLLKMWILWATVMSNKPLIDLLGTRSDEDTDEYKLKAMIVEIIDQMGKILSDTNIKEEFQFLTKLK